MNFAIVGATGNVGRKTIKILEKSKLKISNLFLVASTRSIGKKISFKRKNIKIEALKNYGDMENLHSPIFIIFLKYLIYYDLTWARILYIIICSTSSIIFYLCLKEKLNSKPSLILFCLAQLLFVSPYFRSLMIWPGDESVSILFLLLSILFYFKFEKNKFNNKKFIYLSLNVLLLAICSYFRPTYSFFSIFFFLQNSIN